MKKEIWIWDRLELETAWLGATDLEDVTDIIQDVLGDVLEEEPTPCPEGLYPLFDPGQVVELDWGKKLRVLAFLGCWSDGERDMEVYEVEVEEDL